MEKRKININKAEVIRFLGYREKRPGKDVMSIIDECENALQEVMMPAFTFRILGLRHKYEGIDVMGTDLTLEGNDIARHLSGCDRCALMAATVSIGADRLIKSYEAQDMTKALVADAVASAAVEALCDDAVTEISNRTRSFLTWRYSPGYGDLSLDIQPVLLDILNAQRQVGITLGENNIMIPRKSVTAIIGLSNRSLDLGRQSCEKSCKNCRMRYKCAYSEY